MGKLDEVIEAARRNNIQLVRFIYVGLDGVLRAKASYVDELEDQLVHGIGGSSRVDLQHAAWHWPSFYTS
jgi:hypothetical protein